MGVSKELAKEASFPVLSVAILACVVKITVVILYIFLLKQEEGGTGSDADDAAPFPV